MNFQEAQAAWQADAPLFAERGVIMNGVQTYIPDAWKSNFDMAMDAQPSLSTDPNSGVPSLLTTMIDPTVIRALFAPTKAAEIFGEVKKGTWLDETALFPIVEHTGEMTSYGDNNEDGSTGVNMNWPARQSYLWQTVKQYGEREIERAGLGRINFISEVDLAAANNSNRFANLTYLYGVSGMQTYGALNEPNLSASLTPVTKANGNGNVWMNGTAINASANEVYQDIEALFAQLVAQTGGLVEATDEMTLALSPTSAVALTATNSYNVNVYDLLKKNFPGLRVVTCVQYGVKSSSNPNGVAGGSYAQLIAKTVDGQPVGYCAFNEKARQHPVIRGMSNFKQKQTAGTWGFVLRQPVGIASIIGI